MLTRVGLAGQRCCGGGGAAWWWQGLGWQGGSAVAEVGLQGGDREVVLWQRWGCHVVAGRWCCGGGGTVGLVARGGVARWCCCRGGTVG